MKKLLLSAAILSILSFTALAQEPPPVSSVAGPSSRQFSVGLEFGLPMEEFGDFYTIGFGGSGKMEIPLGSAFNATVTAGFINFYAKEEFSSIVKDAGYIPLKAGGKYYFGNNNYYVEGELGASISTTEGGGTAFAYAPGLGVSYPVSDRGAIDAGARYEGWSKDGGSINQVAFRIAYKFQ